METAQVPAGFREVPAAEATGSRIDKAALTQGVILQFRGTQRFPRKDGDGVTVVHTFLARAGTGERFSLFGTAQLDSKLRAIKQGGTVWLSYAGRKLIDGQETHDWNVSDGGRLTDDALIVLRRHSAKEEDALDAVIRAAQKANAERRAASGFDNSLQAEAERHGLGELQDDGMTPLYDEAELDR